MKFLGSALLSAVAPVLLASSTLAGPNENGALILAAGETIFCQIVDCDSFELENCEDALTNWPGYGSTYSWNVVAAFASDASPRVTGATFGIDFDPSTVFIIDFGACSDFELADGSWPAPGSGTAVTWNTAQTGQLQNIYFFIGYEYYGIDTSFDVIPNPGQGASFADDSVPAELDPIELLGSLGFNNDPGSLPCPTVGQVEGACCLEDCSCIVLTVAECETVGDYQGDGTSCDPNPCVSCPEGACCFDDGSCQVLVPTQCDDLGGEYEGDFTPCDPNPCEIVPTLESSWGEIKAIYR